MALLALLWVKIDQKPLVKRTVGHLFFVGAPNPSIRRMPDPLRTGGKAGAGLASVRFFPLAGHRWPVEPVLVRVRRSHKLKGSGPMCTAWTCA